VVRSQKRLYAHMNSRDDSERAGHIWYGRAAS
jgi:hypothetical protein